MYVIIFVEKLNMLFNNINLVVSCIRENPSLENVSLLVLQSECRYSLLG